MKLPGGPGTLALPAVAIGCALVANALAPGARRLTWGGWAPPPSLASGLPPAPPPSLASGLPPTPPVPPAVAQPRPPEAPAPAAPSVRQAPAQAPAAAPRWAPDPNAASRDITSAEAWAAFGQGLPFLDARRTQDYADGHVPGARSAPVWEAELDTRLTEFEAQANPTPRGPIVIYCGGGGCEDSHLLAHKLEGLGYRNLLIYRDGFPDWTAQGRPTSKAPR